VLEPRASGLFKAVHVLLEEQHTIIVTFVWGKKFFVSDWEVVGFNFGLRVCKDEINLPCPQVLPEKVIKKPDYIDTFFSEMGYTLHRECA
jgi:hypothetical protein